MYKHYSSDWNLKCANNIVMHGPVFLHPPPVTD